MDFQYKLLCPWPYPSQVHSTVSQKLCQIVAKSSLHMLVMQYTQRCRETRSGVATCSYRLGKVILNECMV